MDVFVAFLRAVNVAGRRVANTQLSTAFSNAGMQNVSPFLASGNVRFEVAAADPIRLATMLQEALEATLGFTVATFVRTQREVDEIAACVPFDEASILAATAFSIGLLQEPLTEQQQLQLAGFASEVDRFAVVGREIYWLCQVKQSESRFSSVQMEKALGIQATFRNRNTLQRLATRK